MPALSCPPFRASLTRPRVHAILVLDQIRQGRRLVGQLARQGRQGAEDEYYAWHDYNQHLLGLLLARDDVLQAYLRARYRLTLPRGAAGGGGLLDGLRTELRELESVAERLGDAPLVLGPGPAGPEAPQRTVLVVHGRNVAAKEMVARFLMKLDLEPILLDEQAAHGRTLMEKLEAYSRVSFAVVLLTGDDVGALVAERRNLRPRARQNVIFELGFSLGNLTRHRVCALYQEGVELPSDLHGVEYQPFDPAGAWKSKLARELHAAGVQFDPMKVL